MYNKKKIFIFIILILINYRFFYANVKTIIIEIDISGGITGERGPAKFIKGLNETLPYNTRNCRFIPSKRILPNNGRNKSDFFFLPFPYLSESIYKQWLSIKRLKNLLLGPCFVPTLWFAFPRSKVWYESKFEEVLRALKGVVVHSNRVRNYLVGRTNTTHLKNKFKIVRACTNLKPIHIKNFKDREIDIILFEKYEDLNRSKQGAELFELFNNSSLKVERLKYRYYTKKQMMALSENSKFIIYFSFFDTGAIGLKEIQNHGVISFSHQQDLINNRFASYYIPELADKVDMKKAYKKIMLIIRRLMKFTPNSKKIAKQNQEINKCKKALDDLCKGINIK